MTKIFITSAGGFIGSHLVERLVVGNDVVVFDNFRRDALTVTGLSDHPRLKIVRGDVLDRDALAAAMKGCDTVVHMASIAGVDTVIKNPVERANFGGLWHADTTYLEEPPMGALLYAVELPPYGGDTLFANVHLAYETLSPSLQTYLETLTVIQNSAKAEVAKTREDRIKDEGGESVQFIAEHPAVITHPRTGRKGLYVNSAHTERFKELTIEESEPILRLLFQHLTRPEFTCRFVWTPGALVFWDNYASQHNPINDYHGFKRVMHRVTIGGGRLGL